MSWGIVLIVWSKGWTRCFDSAVDKLRHCFDSVVYSMRHCFGGGWCVIEKNKKIDAELMKNR